MAYEKAGNGKVLNTETGETGVIRRMKGGYAIFISDSKFNKDYKKDKTPSYKRDTELNKKITNLDNKRKNLAVDEEVTMRYSSEMSKKYGELSDEYNNSRKDLNSIRNNIRDVENQRDKLIAQRNEVETKNQFGLSIKKEQADRLRQVGQVEKNKTKEQEFRKQDKEEYRPKHNTQEANRVAKNYYKKIDKKLDENIKEKVDRFKERKGKTETKKYNPMEEYTSTNGTGMSDLQYKEFSKMNLRQLTELAKDYGVWEYGLSEKQLRAKIIAVFND